MTIRMFIKILMRLAFALVNATKVHVERDDAHDDTRNESMIIKRLAKESYLFWHCGDLESRQHDDVLGKFQNRIVVLSLGLQARPTSQSYSNKARRVKYTLL